MVPGECEELLGALSRATARHRLAVLGLGGIADCGALRVGLRRARRLAHRLALASCSRLAAGLQARPRGPDERARLQRLWLILDSLLEGLAMDMRRTLALARAFPLAQPDVRELQRAIQQLGQAMRELEQKVSVSPWTVEAAQPPGAELRAALSASDSSLAPPSVGEEGRSFCHNGGLRLGVVFGALLGVAIVLAVCLGQLA
ncbi:regulator of G-protein signaling 9-binding protein [Tachyglossus aculeatus]|uniref:regulator of G-protein signaling 9-binding protein n=1 Tax=Tachyglossus aculeatus TaxID=9261 RepID=UPI0018F779DA|nr:regulator of G-protein signaling 9-binding protein [Tachyglossus aculeatus]